MYVDNDLAHQGLFATDVLSTHVSCPAFSDSLALEVASKEGTHHRQGGESCKTTNADSRYSAEQERRSTLQSSLWGATVHLDSSWSRFFTWESGVGQYNSIGQFLSLIVRYRLCVPPAPNSRNKFDKAMAYPDSIPQRNVLHITTT